MTETANLTTLTPPKFITDSAGGMWGFVPSPSGMQICYNGIIQTTTPAALLLYFNHTVYYQDNAGKWYVYKTSWTATTDPRVVVSTESPNGTAVTTVGPTIINSSLESWALTSGQQISINGKTDTSTGSVTLLYYTNHIVYQQNSAGGWWSKTKSSDPWTATTDPRTAVSTESPNGTAVTTVGPAIINSSLESWKLTSGQQVSINGKTDTSTGLVTLLYYTNHILYQQNSAGGWWSKTKSSDSWTATTDPRPSTIIGISLSSSSFVGGSPSGTIVGAITVGMNSGTFSGTLSLSGTDAISFALVGNNLVTKGVLAVKAYNIILSAVQAGVVVAFTQAVTITGTGASNYVQVPLGFHLGTWMGDTTAGDPVAHYNLIKSAMGRTPTVIAALGANSANTGWGAPTQWGGGDAGNAAWNGIPPATTAPLLTWTFSDGSTDRAFSAFANGTYDSYITGDLAQWKNRGFKKLYIRINWEFNNDFQGFGVGNAGNIPSWIAAWKHFANVAHAYGAANGMTIKMVWCPTASWSVDIGNTFSRPVVDFFPKPDGATKYIDVVGPDLYAFSWDAGKYPESVSPDTNVSTDINWFITTFVKIAQLYGCSFGISELGDLGGAGQSAWQDWIPNHFVTYFNTLKNLNPPVPIEYFAFFDLNTGGAYQFTNGAYPNQLLAWRRAMGLGASGSTPITTIAVP